MDGPSPGADAVDLDANRACAGDRPPHVLTLPAFPSYVHAVSFAPTGALLATAGIGPNGDAQVLLWDTKTGKVLKALEALPPGKSVPRTTAVKCLVFSPDGKTLAAGGASGMLRLWTVESGD